MGSKARRYRKLIRLVRRFHPTRIMEIGTYRGKRAETLIAHAKRAEPDKLIEYYGFDLFKQAPPEEHSKDRRPLSDGELYSKLRPLGASIFLFPGDTQNTLPTVIPSLPKMDLIFIDGGHSLKTIANDWHWCQMLMHKESIVVFDDYWIDRTDAGCKTLIDSLSRDEFQVSPISGIDSFDNGLSIQLWAVRLKAQA